MTITFPRANLADKLKIQAVKWLLADNQEVSGLASGEIIVADLAPKYWTAEVTIDDMTHSEAVQAQALIESFDGSMNDFYLHDPRMPFPQSDPGGVKLTAGTAVAINGIAASGNAINETYFCEGQPISLSDAVTVTSQSGTYWDAEGILRTAAANTPRLDYGPFANLLKYPQSFETTYWTKQNATCVANAATAPDGTLTADRLVDDATNQIHDFNRLIPCAASTLYITSVYLKKDTLSRADIVVDGGVNNYANVLINLTNGTIVSGGAFNGFANYASSIADAGNGWWRVTLTYRTHSTATSMYVQVRTNAGGSDSYIGTGQGIYVWGLITNLGAAALAYPRVPLGIRMETTFTQMLFYSQQFDNAAWVKSATTITANSTGTANIDDAITADKLVESTANSPHYIAQVRTGVAGTRYTAYFIVKAAERTKVILQLSNSAGSAAEAWFNLIPGTISYTTVFSTDFTSPTSLIKNLGNGWFWCELSAVKGSANTNVYPMLYLVNNLDTATYTGDGVSGVYIGHAQMEASSAGRYPVISTTATVTRTTDTVALRATGTNSWSLTHVGGNYSTANVVGNLSSFTLEGGWLQSWTGTRTVQPGEALVTIAAIAANNKEVKLSGLPPLYELTLGDMCSFEYSSNPVHRALHRFVSSVKADPNGNTDWIEVRPHLSPGAATGLVLTLKKPSARVKIVPGGFNPGTGRRSRTGGMTFPVRQVL